jgi:hypothetical protein
VALDGVGGQRHAPAALSQESYPVPIAQEDGCAPGPAWTGAESLAPTSIPSPEIKPVASRETDWANAALLRRENNSKVGIKGIRL